VRALLTEIVERAARDPTTAGMTVSLGDTPVDAELAADGALLRRALWNLVENAAKYGAPPIRLDAELSDEHVRLSVTDQGGGIAADDRERVLEPFYRGDKARTPGKGGFGLGLTLARRVAEVHGGTIVVSPQPGCRVTLEIPLHA
jgi:signal transduction histidine kinase